MLVLTRKKHQSVIVGGLGDVDHVLKITVLETRSGQVRLGFEAPGYVPIQRLEVWERIRADGVACGAGSDI
jgi:carbon storage regulator